MGSGDDGLGEAAQRVPAASTPRFQIKREAILAAAAQEFNQHGIRGATLAGVASRVGLLKASLNYYYRRKEDLAAECMLQAIAAVHDIAATAREQQRDAEGRVRAFLAGKAALHAEVTESRRGPLVSFDEVRALTAPQGDRVAEAYAQLFRAVREFFPRSLGFSRDQRNARTHLLLALANAMPGWLNRYEAADYPAAADALTDMLVGGLLQPQWHDAALPQPRLAAAPDAGADTVNGAFLRAATMLINEQGFRGASVERISATLNLTKGAFYHHHDSKDDLVAQCFARSFEVIRDTQLRAMALTDSGVQRLLASSFALVCFQLSEQGPLLRSSARSVLAESPRRDTMQRGSQLTQRFALFIVDGMAEGALRTVDATLAAQQVAAMINAASSLRWWVSGIRQDDVVRLFARPLFTGLLSPGEA
ncbi:MAG: TetR family transcriptional regulator [Rubrivivax sp.]